MDLGLTAFVATTGSLSLASKSEMVEADLEILCVPSGEKAKRRPLGRRADGALTGRDHLFPGTLICTGFGWNVTPGGWTGGSPPALPLGLGT